MASFSKRLIVHASNNSVMTSATDNASEVCNVHKVLNRMQLQYNVHRLKAKSYLAQLTSRLGCQNLQEGSQRVAEADVSKFEHDPKLKCNMPQATD